MAHFLIKTDLRRKFQDTRIFSETSQYNIFRDKWLLQVVEGSVCVLKKESRMGQLLFLVVNLR